MSTNTDTSSPQTRLCLRCKGRGKNFSAGFQFQGTTYPDRDDVCHCCKGKGVFEEPNFQVILGNVLGKKGLRSKRPDSDRDYYVWRMARFHGGADVTMPMSAIAGTRGDPYAKELDAFADGVAKKVFGTHYAAAIRWGRLLTNDVTPELTAAVGKLPDSAFECGPVVMDGNKPEEEVLELR